MNVTVTIDTELCISAGMCWIDNPTAFGFDDKRKATVLPGAADLPTGWLIEAARRCPASAILLFDEDGNEVDIFA